IRRHRYGSCSVYGAESEFTKEISMKPRIDSRGVNPKVRQHLLAINGYLHGSSLGSRLLHLVEIRASQINGCAQCLHMHTQDARAEGESEQRLHTVAAWRETPFFDARER